MTRSEVEFVPINHSLARRFYGSEPPATILRGCAAVLDGEPVGMFGLSLTEKRAVVFSEMKPEVRGRKKDIVRAYRQLGELIACVEYPVYAVAQCGEALSERLLQRLGFRATPAVLPQGRLFYRGA